MDFRPVCIYINPHTTEVRSTYLLPGPPRCRFYINPTRFEFIEHCVEQESTRWWTTLIFCRAAGPTYRLNPVRGEMFIARRIKKLATPLGVEPGNAIYSHLDTSRKVKQRDYSMTRL